MAWSEVLVGAEAEANWREEYAAKQISLDQLFEQHVTGGQRIYFGGLHVPNTVVNELLRRVREEGLSGIDIWANWMNGSIDLNLMDVLSPDVFRYHTYFAGPNERAGFGRCVSHVPVHFSDVWSMLAAQNLDYAIVQMTPPNEKGYCNIGPVGFVPGGVRSAKRIIACVNPNLPRVFGDTHDYHVSQIDAFVLQPEALDVVPVVAPTSEELKVAELVTERVNDGDTVQLGIGGISDAIGESLKSKRHLGCHTEMYSDVLVGLQQAGVIDNSRKSFMPGVSVGGYSTGSQRLYDYINENPEVQFRSYNMVCNPNVIAKNDNLVSINTAVSIDLTGQVCAESIGSRQYSASGGQFDFVRGVKHSEGGRGFIAVTSVAHTKKGPVSKIAPILAPGSAVTSLRNDLQYVATEYGIADLRWADLETRAKRLISIAHPDFRAELTHEAKKMGLVI